jgi:molybdopterin converting factor subunit 1
MVVNPGMSSTIEGLDAKTFIGDIVNRIKLLFFATIRDRAGAKSLDLEIPADLTIQGLKDKLSMDYPNLKESMKSVLITINREYAFDEAVVPMNAEVGMFPPVSGG